MVIASGSTASFTPTQIPSQANLTTTLISTTTDGLGEPIGIIIFATSGGRGWQFPCILGCQDGPFPPAPPLPPPLIGSESSNLDTVTSTITTVLPGFSTQLTSNMEWTDNTWVKTNVGGTSTIVPVIVSNLSNITCLHGEIFCLWVEEIH